MARKKKTVSATPLTAPETREEHYLANIAGLVDTKPAAPFNRVERYLDTISSGIIIPSEAQLAALNSGITAGKVNEYDAYSDTKLDVVGMGINLFDNSYFIGGGATGEFPINQFGKTGASAYPNEGVTIDRWKQPGGCTTGWENGVFTVKLTGYYSSFRQYLSESVLTEGQQYTVSVLTATGLHFFTFTASKSNGAQSEGYENGLYFYIAWDSVTNRWYVNLATNGAESSELVAFQPRAAKLELGSRQTLARQVNNTWVLNNPAPNYQQELAKCQRYLQIIKPNHVTNGTLIGSGYVNNGPEVLIAVPLSVPMAPITSVTSTGVSTITNGSVQPISAISLFCQAENLATLDLTLIDYATSPQYSVSTAYIINGGSLIILAE